MELLSNNEWFLQTELSDFQGIAHSLPLEMHLEEDFHVGFHECLRSDIFVDHSLVMLLLNVLANAFSIDWTIRDVVSYLIV